MTRGLAEESPSRGGDADSAGTGPGLDAAPLAGRLIGEEGGAHFVPLASSGGASLYGSLARQLVAAAKELPADAAALVMDAFTAELLVGAGVRLDHLGGAAVLGRAPAAWEASPGVRTLPANPAVGPAGRLVLLITPRMATGLAGDARVRPAGGEGFDGVWTAHRSTVLGLLRGAIGEEAAEELLGALPPAEEGTEEEAVFTMRLMALLAQELAERERMLAQDKDELATVLNILKAISARRRAHDILFVFVEQIAKVVVCDRCSVVRVWGDERRGQVLASHEDEKVFDRAIEIEKYPELEHTLAHGTKAVIEDVRRHPLTERVSEQLEAAGIRSLIVIPVVWNDPEVGSLLLRAARREGGFSPRELSFMEIVAEAAANALERVHLFEVIQRANARLERLAVTDGLTGLFNHRFFRERIDEEFERAQRYRLPLSCMIFDVDDFKRINDTHGHLQGDAVLQEIARRTSESVRRSDIVARYGGEEFIVIMPQTGRAGALAEAERVRAVIAEEAIDGGRDRIPVTVSAGLATLDNETMPDSEALLRAADNALYQAKTSGKNRVVMHEGTDT